MDSVALLRRMWEHTVWADRLLWPAVVPHAGTAMWKEYAHVLGAEEVWLSRLERRASLAAVWPELLVDEAATLRDAIESGYRALFNRITASWLELPVEYTNSAGRTFASTPADILSHVALHGQYHRGKINLMLRSASQDPVPADFISFARGVPAATTAAART